MNRRGKRLAFTVAATGLVVVLGDRILFTPSEITIVNLSGHALQNVIVACRDSDYREVIASMSAGEQRTMTPLVSDSKVITLQFDYSGRTLAVSDCGCIDRYRERRKLTILPEGTRVEIGFGSTLTDVVDCELRR